MKTIAIVLLAVLLAGAAAADYQIRWSSINAGGGLGSSASYRLNGTAGQPAAGFVQSTSLLHWIGFWAAEVPTPTVVQTVGDAKLLPDGTFVSVPGKIATSGEGDFASFFCLEDADRTGGIRVAVSASTVPGLVRGSVLNVIGTIATNAYGERYVSGPIVIIASTAAPLTPLGMPNCSLGGADLGVPPLGQAGVMGGTGLNNIGLLVRTWGEVKVRTGSYILISDGSIREGAPLLIKVNTAGLSDVPNLGDYVSITGIMSLAPGLAPYLLPRSPSDMQ